MTAVPEDVTDPRCGMDRAFTRRSDGAAERRDVPARRPS
jgi:hypothetical protein